MKPIAVIAGLICGGAGLYLLNWQSVDEGNWFEYFAHGVGIYFIGKGLFVAAVLWHYAERALEEGEKRLERRARRERLDAPESAPEP